MPRSMTLEEIDRQTLRAYSSDRLPGIGDRNALGETGRRRLRLRDGLCTQCGGPILGRPGNATTCLLHRAYPGPLSRSELVERLEATETLAESLRVALAAMDEAEGVGA